MTLHGIVRGEATRDAETERERDDKRERDQRESRAESHQDPVWSNTMPTLWLGNCDDRVDAEIRQRPATVDAR